MSDNNGSEGARKRVRQVNYSIKEKSVLVHLVNKYKKVLENKKTDAATNCEKDRTWKKVAEEFNAQAPNNTYRDATSLKKAYKNLKTDTRKEAAEQKTEIRKTGGGLPPPKPKNPLLELTLETMNKKTVYGLNNPYDSDNNHFPNIDNATGKLCSQIQPKVGKQLLFSDGVNTQKTDEEVYYIQYQDDKPSELQDSSHDVPESDDDKDGGPMDGSAITSTNSGQATDHTWRKWANNFKQPNTIQSTKAKESPWKARRRPTAALHSTEISRIYSELGQERLEIAALEKKALLEHQIVEEKKTKLQLQILETELNIKQEQLKRLQFSRFSNE